MDTDTDTIAVPVDEDAASAPTPVEVEPDRVTDVPFTGVRAPEKEEVNAVIAVDGDGISARNYPSLYDSKASTIVAVLLGMLIVGGIQLIVHNIHKNAKTDYRALTQFVTMMVALVLGAYMADLLIAGPDTSLLSDDEHTIILGFVKDICLMVFSYYFGTRSASNKSADE